MVIESTGIELTSVDLGDAPSKQVQDLLAAVSEPARWSVLRVLGRGEACVCHIQEYLPLAANLLSYHLKVLREVDLVTSSRRGRLVFYRLVPDAAHRVQSALPFGSI